MVELNELSIVLIVLMVMIIAAIVILGQRKKKKYQESAAKAKQESQALRAQSKATPSKDAARFEDGRIIPSKNPFGRTQDIRREYPAKEPYIADLDEQAIHPNQQELAFENEPLIGDFDKALETKAQASAVATAANTQPNVSLESESFNAGEVSESWKPAQQNADVSLSDEVSLEKISRQALEKMHANSSDLVSETAPNAAEKAQAEAASRLQQSQARQRQALDKIMNSDRVEPKTFALIVIGKDQIDLTDIHQFMMANNLIRTHEGFYEYQDSRGNRIFQAVNMLKPGTFASNPGLKDKTPGVMFVLELPTPYSTAPGAMHTFITVAKKLANRTDAQVYNEEQHLVGEHYYHSLRDSALGYESTKVMP